MHSSNPASSLAPGRCIAIALALCLASPSLVGCLDSSNPGHKTTYRVTVTNLEGSASPAEDRVAYGQVREEGNVSFLEDLFSEAAGNPTAGEDLDRETWNSSREALRSAYANHTDAAAEDRDSFNVTYESRTYAVEFRIYHGIVG